ncbi:globin domain-containing protein [Kitasatospora sp. NBC_00240]|uniref:globin domain-containing protein n=1 Tax=Kitasatospora sp. NBC_00240 TaxID=2903567 RepID=UPI002258B1D4|nr:globin domain-containing protein [Kitasatospora sp. NBC_00240]MCX5211910.1 globin domain-containing protein [Kitasatospora sp. NBC_00240]
MPLDPAVIRASFAVVERRADHMAKYFYAHLFAHHPGVRDFFPEQMAEQRDRLFAALTQLVLRLESPGQLTGYLRALGRDHRKFQAAPEHYPAVGASLIAALRHFSGHSWTLEIEKAWTEAFSVIAQVMTEAAAEDEPESPAWWEAEVTTRRRCAPDVVVLTLAPDRPYSFTAGQYLSLCSPRVPRVWRPYSIANAPRPDGSLELHVRRVRGGLLSTALVDDVMPGDRLRLGPALGDACLVPGSRRPLLAVAGGTGWGQIKALLEELLAGPDPRRAMVYLAARDDADQYDLATVERLVERYRRLDVLLAAPADGADRSSANGLLTDGLRAHGDWAGWDIHLSGPPGLAPEITELLLGLGAEPERIRHDPVPETLNRTRPLTSSDWFLDRRDVAWINRTELGRTEPLDLEG